MTEQDKPLTQSLDDRSDYALLRQRAEAACNSMGRTASFTSDELPSGADREKFAEQFLQVSFIIVSALGDHSILVLRTLIGRPTEMLEKVDTRFDSKPTACKISKMVELVSLRYAILKQDMTKHIYKVASIVELLKSMQDSMDESLSGGTPIASIYVVWIHPVVAAINTFADSDINWDSLLEHLIEEKRGLKKTVSSVQ